MALPSVRGVRLQKRQTVVQVVVVTVVTLIAAVRPLPLPPFGNQTSADRLTRCGTDAASATDGRDFDGPFAAADAHRRWRVADHQPRLGGGLLERLRLQLRLSELCVVA